MLKMPKNFEFGTAHADRAAAFEAELDVTAAAGGSLHNFVTQLDAAALQERIDDFSAIEAVSFVRTPQISQQEDTQTMAAHVETVLHR